MQAFLAGRLSFLDIAAVIEETLEREPARAVHSFDALGEADARARRVAGVLVADARRRLTRTAGQDEFPSNEAPQSRPATLVRRMSYVLAFLGFAVLILFHEAGHFVAAKAVGMRVERFSLFFGPMLWKVRRGETEYGVAAIPLGGYVKITGMNPSEELSDGGRAARLLQPAGVEADRRDPRRSGREPADRVPDRLGAAPRPAASTVVVQAGRGRSADQVPPRSCCKPGDQLVSVDGVSGTPDAIRNQIGTHRCAGCTDERLSGRDPGPDRRATATASSSDVRAAYPRYVAADKAPEARIRLRHGEQSRSVPVHAASHHGQRPVARDDADRRGRGPDLRAPGAQATPGASSAATPSPRSRSRTARPRRSRCSR